MNRPSSIFRYLALPACALLSACNDDTSGTGLSAGAGQFAVVSSNYMGATSISLLGPDGEVTHPEWVGSKTENPKLRSPLSEDVVLTSVSSDGRTLTTIVRTLGVITRFDVKDGAVLGQLRADDSPEDDEAAFHSNPQDVLYVSETSAWVSRWQQNPDDAAEERERGNDLIEWNPTTFERTGRRIDLRDLNESIEEEQFDKDGNSQGKRQAVAYASPNAIVPVGGFAAVGITGISESYNYGPGKLAIVDLARAKLLHVLELDGVANCGEVKPVPGDDRSVIVGCIGAYGDEGAGAGILKVTVDAAGLPKVTRAFRVAQHEGAANTASNLAALGGDTVIAVAAGRIDPKTMQADLKDRLFKVDLETGDQTELHESAGAFSLGVPAFDRASGVLLVPDAGSSDRPEYGVQRFEVSADHDVKHDAFIEVAPNTTLAARQVLAL